MKKEMLMLLLAGVGACGSVKHTQNTQNSNKVENQQKKKISVTVNYYGDLDGKNKGIYLNPDLDEENKYNYLKKISVRYKVYTINFSVDENITINDFIKRFHKETGLNSSYTVYGGAPPHRTPSKAYYYHRINGEFIDKDKTLKSSKIDVSKPIIIRISGGGRVD